MKSTTTNQKKLLDENEATWSQIFTIIQNLPLQTTIYHYHTIVSSKTISSQIESLQYKFLYYSKATTTSPNKPLKSNSK